MKCTVPLERGPAWLARLLYCPPEWLGGAVALLGAFVVLAAAVGYRRAGLDEEVAADMADNLAAVGSVGGSGWVLSLTEAPYWVIVVGALVVGIVIYAFIRPHAREAGVQAYRS